MRRLVSNAALSAALLLAAPACASTEQAPQPTVSASPEPISFGYLTAPVTASQRRDIEAMFTATKTYWLQRGVGVAATKLAIVDGKAIFHCGSDAAGALTNANMQQSDFCRQNNTVVLSRLYINSMEFPLAEQIRAQPDQIMELIINHEMGHAVQMSKGEMNASDAPAARRAMELQADCYAGESLQAIDSSALTVVARFNDYFNAPDPIDGTAAQRIASELRGATTGDC